MIIHTLLKDAYEMEELLKMYEIPFKKVIEKDRTNLYKSYEYKYLPRYTYNEKWVNNHIRFDIKKADWAKVADNVKKLFGKGTQSYLYFKDYKKHKYDISLPENNIDVKYPIYIISYKRSKTLITMKYLEEMKLNYYIVIKECDKNDYERELKKKNYKGYTLLVMDKDFFDKEQKNGNSGGIPQRNYCWTHCRDVLKEKSHWLLDDNIKGFYYYNYDNSCRIMSSCFFSYMEQFRNNIKENIGILSPNYTHDVHGYRKPFNVNNKNYSCLLINNDLLDKNNIKWRKQYNEDVRLTLECLNNGIRTIGFNMFLANKCSTGSIKGGNCEIYEYERGRNYEKQTAEYYKKKEEFEAKVLSKCLKYGYNKDYINGIYDMNEEYLYYRGFMLKFLELYCEYPLQIKLKYKHKDKRPHHMLTIENYKKGDISKISFKVC